MAAVLLTVGHGTLEAQRFAALLAGAGVESLVDIRTAPGSRHNPQFSRTAMQSWLHQDHGIAYRWEQRLGGFRKPQPQSPNSALRHPSFRGYADWMHTRDFDQALQAVLSDAATRRTAVMCSESVWWRCHRRLVADAASLLHAVTVHHLMHDGILRHHVPTDGVRTDTDNSNPRLVYDAGQPGLPDISG